MSESPSQHVEPATPPVGFLPRVLPPGSVGYHVFLSAIAIFILGPLGGVAASYMNFKLGTFVPGQVLAGILGSLVTYFYGPTGRHGANYMQSMAASVAAMGAMSVLVQAMVWLGMPQPPVWQLILYYLCIGMFGVGVGMLYTPILVDRLKLTYPSGLAVANILRALTDVRLLRRSVGQLGGGALGGGLGAFAIDRFAKSLEALTAAGQQVSTGLLWLSTFSPVTVGGGMIVGARIAVPALVVGGIGVTLTPWLREHHYLAAHDPFRRIGFIFALGTILGAAIIDLSLLARDTLATIRAARTAGPAPSSGEPKTNVKRLLLWVGFWATALVVVANTTLGVPVPWLLFAIGMAFIFQMINGISQGITDQNPISSAFVVTVLLMSLLGLRDPLIGLFAGSILLVSCSVGVDMQQDRSTGWRLGSDRALQFRYQVIGVVMGAVLTVGLARVFLNAFPALNLNLFAHPELRETTAKGWQSAMTYKFVGVLNTLGEDKTRTLSVMLMGIAFGLTVQVARKFWLGGARYQAWKRSSRGAAVADFVLDAVLLASPYASSFGGFIEFETSVWWSVGGVFASVFNYYSARAPKKATAPGTEALPEDMSTMSLIGGGIIAGESIFTLILGLTSLVAEGALGKLFGG